MSDDENEEKDLEILRKMHAKATTTSAPTASKPQTMIQREYFGLKLRDADLKLLSGPRWINDEIIAFYFKYLKHTIFGTSREVLLVKPSVSFMLNYCTSSHDFKVNAEPLRLKSRQLVLIPLANELHWYPSVSLFIAEPCYCRGLLVFSRSDQCFRYYDSVRGALLNHARVLARRIAPFCAEDVETLNYGLLFRLCSSSLINCVQTSD